MAKEDFQTTTGFRSGYILTVTDSHFAPPTDKNPNASLVWSGVDEEGEEVENALKVGLGENWATFDGGETVDHAEGNELKNGQSRKFHTNSGYGKVINLFAQQAPEEVLENLPSPRNANIWIGTRWYMDEVDQSFTPKGKERVEIKKVLPVRFEGFASDYESGSATTTNSGDGEISPAIVEKLTQLALGCEDHSSFMNAALELTEVQSDDNIISRLADEDFFKSLIAG